MRSWSTGSARRKLVSMLAAGVMLLAVLGTPAVAGFEQAQHTRIGVHSSWLRIGTPAPGCDWRLHFGRVVLADTAAIGVFDICGELLRPSLPVLGQAGECDGRRGGQDGIGTLRVDGLTGKVYRISQARLEGYDDQWVGSHHLMEGRYEEFVIDYATGTETSTGRTGTIHVTSNSPHGVWEDFCLYSYAVTGAVALVPDGI